MHNDIAVIQQQPAVAGISFDFPFLFEFFMNVFRCAFGERVQHAVAGAGADDEIIREGGNVFQVHQNNIFSFFVFERIDNFACKVQSVQGSPLMIVKNLFL